MDHETMLISSVDDENHELVEVPVFDNENVVIDTGSYEVSSTLDLDTEIVESSPLELEDGRVQEEDQQIYAVVCTDSNGDIVEEVTVDNDHESVIEITVDETGTNFSNQLCENANLQTEEIEAESESERLQQQTVDTIEDINQTYVQQQESEKIADSVNIVPEAISSETVGDTTVDIVSGPNSETIDDHLNKEYLNDHIILESKIVSEITIETPDNKSTDLVNDFNNDVVENATSNDSFVNQTNENEDKTKVVNISSTSDVESSAILDTTDVDATPTAVTSPPEIEEEEGDWIIDTSKKIELKVDAVMWINSHKCIIQKHPEKEGQLIAYHVRERHKKRKGRGRPRKISLPPNADDEEDELEEKPKPVVDKAEKGFVQMADATGAVVKRSARKRKRASHLDEYETGIVGPPSDNDDQSVAEEEEDYNKAKFNAYSLRGRGVRGRGRGRIATPVVSGRGRGRGRPRRFNPEPVKVEDQKTKVTKPQQQAYLVQMADGRNVVVQVPVTGLGEGMTSQSLAMSVAEALSSGQSSGVFNVLLQRGSGSTTTTEKICIKKDEKTIENKPEPTPVSTPAATPIPLTVVSPKSDSPPPSDLKTSEEESPKLSCSKCDFQGVSSQEFQEHVLSSHSDVLVKCKCCNHVTLSESEMVDHFKENHQKCICTVCNCMVDTPTAMKKHMATHLTGEVTCHICGKSYKDRYVLRIHMRMVHMPAKVLFECPMCPKKFNKKAALVRHISIHNSTKPYKCSDCDYQSNEKSDLSKHMLIHDEPKHICEVCGLAFRHLRNKEIHMKRHAEQKDYKCMACDFAGYTFTEVKNHITKKHAADPNIIICLKCGQAFSNELQLNEHQASEQCETFVSEEALMATENLPEEIDEVEEIEEVEEMDCEETTTNGEPPSINLNEDTLSLVVNSSDLLDLKPNEEETLTTNNTDAPCESQTIGLVDGVEFDGSHGLLTLLSEDGQVIRGIILDSGEFETQLESGMVVEEVT